MITSELEARAYISTIGGSVAIGKLDQLQAALILENERQNLVSRGSLAEIWVRHFADSAQLLAYVPRGSAGRWLDMGSGAGFPGLVIAILRPDHPVVLVELRKRRVEWLAHICGELDLQQCQVVGERLEQVKSCNCAVISARAFAPLPKLLNLSARFSTADTHWVLPKGRLAAQEVNELPKRLKSMFHVEQSLTDPEAGIVVGRGTVETKR